MKIETIRKFSRGEMGRTGNIVLTKTDARLLVADIDKEMDAMRTVIKRDEALMASYNADIGALVCERDALKQANQSGHAMLEQCRRDLQASRDLNAEIAAKLNPAYDETHTDLRERLRIVERELADEKEQVRRLEEIRLTLRDEMSKQKKQAEKDAETIQRLREALLILIG